MIIKYLKKEESILYKKILFLLIFVIDEQRKSNDSILLNCLLLNIKLLIFPYYYNENFNQVLLNYSSFT